MTFGDKIKAYRKKHKLTQNEFIAKLNIDFTHAYLSMVENKGEIPKPKKLFELIKGCDLDIDKTIAQVIKERCERYRKRNVALYKRAMNS